MRNSIIIAITATVLTTYAEAVEYMLSKDNEGFLAKGVICVQGRTEKPRTMRYTAVKIDLETPGLEFTGTKSCEGAGAPLEEAKSLYDGKGEKLEPAVRRVKRETVADFLVREKCVFAFMTRPTRGPYSGDFANPRGLLISSGKVIVDEKHGRGPVLFRKKDGTMGLADRIMKAEYGEFDCVWTGDMIIRRDGKDTVDPERKNIAPCCVAGFTSDHRYLYVVTVDDGNQLKWGTGADYHELNAILSKLGIEEAISFDHGCQNAMAAADSDGKPYQPNRLGGTDAFQRVCVIAGVKHSGAKAQVKDEKAKAAANPAKVTASLKQTRMVLFKDLKRHEALLKGEVRATVKSAEDRVKRPVLNICALFDVDGVWRYNDIILCDQKTRWGHCLDHDQTPAQVSMWQPEVTMDAWKEPIYGDFKAGVFSGYGLSPNRSKLLGYRLELWQNGGLVAVYESDKRPLRKLGVPEDWYVKGKYLGKITYRWPPPPEDKKK